MFTNGLTLATKGKIVETYSCTALRIADQGMCGVKVVRVITSDGANGSETESRSMAVDAIDVISLPPRGADGLTAEDCRAEKRYNESCNYADTDPSLVPIDND